MNLVAAPTPDEPDPSDLADALEEIHRRQAAGEPVDLAEFRARLGPRFAELDGVLTAEAMLDAALGDDLPGPLELPRPFGPYTLVREVGRGGAGVVYEAVERALGRTVALKVLRLSLEDDAQALARFQREASACARVRHDCIVAVHGHGVAEGRAYYAMDLVKGAPLSRLIAEKRLPPREELALALAGVADALQALHAAGTVHRDVKPANLLMREDGRLVLADFGLARTPEAATLTRTGAMVGTPAYMSPEQVLGRQDAIDARSDVYGLGAVLYECLAGRVPFLTDAWPQLVSLIVAQRPVPPGVHGRDVPAPLARIALKALEKDPADRYATAAAMADDLRAFAEGREVLGRPVPRLVRAVRWARRRWVPLAAAGVVVGAGLLLWSRRSGELYADLGMPVEASVSVDGVPRGRTPIRVSLAPGPHEVKFEHADFKPMSRVVQVRPGALEPLVPGRLEFLDDTKQEVRERHVSVFLNRTAPGSLPAGLPDVGTRRSGSKQSVTLMAPRGAVRARDLTWWWVEVDPANYRRGGRLTLSRGGEQIWETQLEAGTVQAFGSLDLADVVRSGLRPGELLQLGYIPPAAQEGPATEPVTLRIEEDALGKDALAASDQRFGPLGEFERHLAQAAHLRRLGLASAGLLACAQALERRPESPTAVALFGWMLLDLESWHTRAGGEIQQAADVGPSATPAWMRAPAEVAKR